MLICEPGTASSVLCSDVNIRTSGEFSEGLLAQSVGGGHMSVGILVGLIVIFFSFVITGIYVHKANTVFEPLSKKLHEAAEDLS